MKRPVKSLVMGKEVTYQCYEWQKYLIYKGKKHSKPLHHAKVSLIPQRVDISLRPEIINVFLCSECRNRDLYATGRKFSRLTYLYIFQ